MIKDNTTFSDTINELNHAYRVFSSSAITYSKQTTLIDCGKASQHTLDSPRKELLKCISKVYECAYDVINKVDNICTFLVASSALSAHNLTRGLCLFIAPFNIDLRPQIDLALTDEIGFINGYYANNSGLDVEVSNPSFYTQFDDKFMHTQCNQLKESFKLRLELLDKLSKVCGYEFDLMDILSYDDIFRIKDGFNLMESDKLRDYLVTKYPEYPINRGDKSYSMRNLMIRYADDYLKSHRVGSTSTIEYITFKFTKIIDSLMKK